jgi:hypothetical protein
MIRPERQANFFQMAGFCNVSMTRLFDLHAFKKTEGDAQRPDAIG